MGGGPVCFAILLSLGGSALADETPVRTDVPAQSLIDYPAMSVDAEPSSTVGLAALDTRMTVAVLVNGQGPFRFIVDTGANRTVISETLATLLKLPEVGEVWLNSVAGRSKVASVEVSSITVGGLATKSMVAPVLKEVDLGALGILGIDALEGRKVVIDLLGNRMTVEAPDRSIHAASSDEIVVVGHRKAGQLVLADADAAGQRVFAVVDTGSQVSIGNDALRERLIRRRRATPTNGEIIDVTGRAISASYAPISKLRLGSWRIKHGSIAFAEAHAFSCYGLTKRPSMLLGMDLIKSFKRVSIDFSRKTVRLTRRSDPPDTSSIQSSGATPLTSVN